MKKMAFFVEGQTEELFVRALVLACAGECNVKILSKMGNLGKKHTRIFIEVEAKNVGTGEDYFVLIINSSSEDSIISDIREIFKNLVRENYVMILGLRDVRPNYSREEIGKLQAGMNNAVSKLDGIPINIYLSIMEMEAWLLAENTHFLRISPELTEDRIIAELGFLPDNKNVEGRDVPSDDLAAIYGIAEILYDKSRALSERVMSVLNFEDVINIHSLEIGNLGGVVGSVTDFFEHGELE